jgi:hypothetical protein
MDKQQAIDLVQETFESAFERTRFIKFIRELFNGAYEPAEINRVGNLIPDAFEQSISKYERIGKYIDSEDKRIDLLIVYLKRDTSIERARSMQRNFVAGYLQGKYGTDAQKDAALVAFVAPDEDDWRFSLVKLEYSIDTSNEAKPKIKDELTPARRWSFLVGSQEKSHTAQRQFQPILQNEEQNPTLAELEDAFNIETVTKEFFLEYRRLFIQTKEELDKAIAADPKIRADFENKGIDTVNLAKKLLGQIIFLYYLQKKGWFGVPRGAKWGEGSRSFLRDLLKKKHGDYNNFFNDILEPLFYDALRNDRSHDDHYYNQFKCKIPFLNGGLFDPMNNYDWVNTDILLSNDLFSNENITKEGDKGNGILDIFDRYNFTVKEDEPFEKEVAIDPELLGKAYEKFNAIRPDNYAEFKAALTSGKKGEESKFNKQYGVYYTPREIVHYMCQQSLINYLYSELNPNVVYQSLGEDNLDMFGNAGKSGQLDLSAEHHPMNEISKEDIATLILHGELIRENEAQVENAGRETEKYQYKMPESIRTNEALIDQKLADIKICDPAVGSGAFPVGMMSEIIKARESLSKNKGISIYQFKRKCIENSLYGVDIDPGAVEIAKLRLWLSLIVDEDDIQNIKPLPNLDYKIVCGNSLMGLPEGILLDLHIKTELEERKKKYFYITNPNTKLKMREEINDLFSRLVESAKQFDPTLGEINFDFHTHFSEVFHNEDGFDIVIGNPPYVDSETMAQKDSEEREKIAKIFQTTKGNWDLYIPFWEKSIKLMSPNGTATLITPNKWLSISYGKTLRQFSKKYVYHLVDYSKFRAFDDAGVFAVVAFMGKQRQENIRITSFIDKNDSAFDLLVPIQTFNEFENWGAFLSLHLPLVFSLIKNKAKLESLCDVEEPFTVSEAYLLSDIMTEQEKLKERVLRFINTGTIESYFTLWGIKPTTYLKKKYIKPVISESQMKAKFPRRYTQSKDKKIIISGIRHFECFLDDEGEWVAGKSTVILRNFQNEIASKFILGILNSKVTKFFLQECYGSLGMDGGINFSPSNVSQIPIPNIQNKKPIESLVERILAAKGINPQADTSALEGEIDQLVYALYELTEEEIKIVEGR